MDQHTMKVSDLYDIAIFDISRDGEQWRKYLEFSARGNLYRFDFLNTCIIYEQYPEAEILLGFSDWKKAKRYVRGGEIGIATFPIEMLGGAQYVYDIKSTGGRLCPKSSAKCPGYGKLMKKMLLLSQRNCFQNNIRKKKISG